MNISNMKNSDWLAETLKKTRLSPIRAGLVVLVLNIIVDFTLAFVFGGLFPSQQSHGLLREPIALTADLLVPSFLVGYYCWIQSAYPKIFETLLSEKIVGASEQVDQIFRSSSSYLNSRGISSVILIISMVSGFSFALSVPISDPSYVGWVSVHPAIPWVRSLFNVFSIYIATMLIFDIIVLTYTFSQIFSAQNIVMKPSHPDKAGGLGIIGRFSANLGYLIGVFGLLVSISLLTNTMPNTIASIGLFFVTKVGGLILYIIMTPILFFVPLYSAHKAMVKFRDDFLLDIGKEIDQEYSKIQGSYEVLEPLELERITKRINYFRELYSQAKDFPVWPFNESSVKKFYGFVIGAILPGLTSIAFDLAGLIFK